MGWMAVLGLVSSMLQGNQKQSESNKTADQPTMLPSNNKMPYAPTAGPMNAGRMGGMGTGVGTGAGLFSTPQQQPIDLNGNKKTTGGMDLSSIMQLFSMFGGGMSGGGGGAAAGAGAGMFNSYEGVGSTIGPYAGWGGY